VKAQRCNEAQQGLLTFDGERRKLIAPTSQSQHEREPAWSCNSGGLFSFLACRYVSSGVSRASLLLGGIRLQDTEKKKATA